MASRKESRPLLTQERLKELVKYDPETGLFTRAVEWRAGPGRCSLRAPVGAVCGTDNGEGYVTLMVDKLIHKAHRLAWLYMMGEHPTGHMDHINGTRDDNRWCNLRMVDNQTNVQNITKARRTNKSTGVLGVTMRKDTGRFEAHLGATIDGKARKLWLGSHETLDDAKAARDAAARKHHDGCTL